MISRLNFSISFINLLLIFLYLVFITIDLIRKEFEYLLILIILINLLIKLYSWHNLIISKKKYLNFIINYIFFNERFTKLCIFMFSTMTPIYMIVQKDSLIIDLFVQKLSFFMVFVLSLIGFYLEFFTLESKSNK